MSGRDIVPTGPFMPVLGLMEDFFRQQPFSDMVPFAASSALREPGAHRDMPLDVHETDKSIEVLADIPGVKKEDIQLNIDHNILSLSVTSNAARDNTGEHEGVTWHHTERSRSYVKRSLRLPENADQDNVAASYEQGVLKVTVPKVDARPTAKTIAIG